MNKKILLTASGVTVVGLIIVGLVFAIDSIREGDDREKTSKKNCNQTPEKEEKKLIKENLNLPSVVNIPDGILSDSYETAEDLLRDVLYYFLTKELYTNPRDLLDSVNRACTIRIDDYSWYEQLPRTLEDLFDIIDKFEYSSLYKRHIGENN